MRRLLLRWVWGLRCLVRGLLCWLGGRWGLGRLLVLGGRALGEGLLANLIGLAKFVRGGVRGGGVLVWLLVWRRRLLACERWEIRLRTAVCGAGVCAKFLGVIVG